MVRDSERRVRVLQFADVINRRDFIDVIIRHADPTMFWLGACTFTSTSNIEPPRFADDDIPHWVLHVDSRRDFAGAAVRLARLLRSENIDILHTHHYVPAVIGWIATRIHPQTQLVVGRHYSDAIYLNSQGARRRLLLSIEAQVNRRATSIVVPTTMIRDLLVERQGVEPAKIQVVPYAFDALRYPSPPSDEVRCTRQSLDADDRFIVGTFARLYRDKGHRYLAEALAELPLASRHSVRWLVVGDGPDRREVERVVRDSGIDDLTVFLGWRNDALRLMAACDVIVQPTIQEAFSQAMVESLWMRRPLVMSRVSGVDDLLVDGVNALVVPARDPRALAAAVERIRTQPALAWSIARAGRQTVESTLTLDQILPLYEQVYRRAYEGTARSPGRRRPRRSIPCH